EAAVVAGIVGVVEQEAKAGAGIDTAVGAALGTDLPVGFQILFPDDLAAPFTLLPETFGAHTSFRVTDARQFVIVAFVPLEPRHGKNYVSAGTDAPARRQTHDRSVRRAWHGPIRAETSSPRARVKRRRAAARRPEGRRDRRSKIPGRGLPFRLWR